MNSNKSPEAESSHNQAPLPHQIWITQMTLTPPTTHKRSIQDAQTPTGSAIRDYFKDLAAHRRSSLASAPEKITREKFVFTRQQFLEAQDQDADPSYHI